uniref:Secreted protein n=1 Tax=Pyxicephalus adspersus TaxID=30357 RepID=A0AAV3AI19_PYXAD|nr:TPA: hypothetical protein GDO54_014520 [Pyxicephalus adspersus]
MLCLFTVPLLQTHVHSICEGCPHTSDHIVQVPGRYFISFCCCHKSINGAENIKREDLLYEGVTSNTEKVSRKCVKIEMSTFKRVQSLVFCICSHFWSGRLLVFFSEMAGHGGSVSMY